MKKILIQIPGHVPSDQYIFEQDVNNQNEKWRTLKRLLAPLGYEVVGACDHPLDDSVAWVLFIDSLSIHDLRRGGQKGFLRRLLKKEAPDAGRPLYEEAVRCGMKDKLVLFLWEGPVVVPENYNHKIWNMFNRIFTWNDDLVDNKKFFKFCLPTPPHPFAPNTLPFAERKLLVNMSANKSRWSSHELFSARVNTSKYFDSHYPEEFDLYGARWHKPVTRLQTYFPWLVPRFSSYRGIAKDKLATLSRYKFALGYENTGNCSGQVTEKLFDIMQAGVVPIYWGAPNVEEYVDPRTYIDRRKFKNDAALAEYLTCMREEEYEKMVAAGQEYLKSAAYRKFSPEAFCERIIEVLKIRE